MRATIGRKLGLGIGILLTLFVLSGLVYYNQIESIDNKLRQISDESEPLSTAVYNMRINLINIEMGTLEYLKTGGPEYRELVQKNEADFQKYKSQYDSLIKRGDRKELIKAVDLFYDNFKTIRDTLFSARDTRDSLLADIGAGLQKLNGTTKEIQKQIDRKADDGNEKDKRAGNMEFCLLQLDDLIENYPRIVKKEYQGKLFAGAKNFEEELNAFKKLKLNDDERLAAGELDAQYSQMMSQLDETFALENSIQTNTGKFSERRKGINNILSRGLEVLTQQKLSASEIITNIRNSLERTQQVVLGLFIISLLIAAAVILTISRSTAKAVRKLLEGVNRISGGDLDYRIHVDTKDEISDVALAFNEMSKKRKNVEKELRESEEKFRNLVEYLSDWVWKMDTNGSIAYSNRQSVEIIGYEPEEIMGKTLFDFMSPEQAQRASEILNQYIAERKPFKQVELVLVQKDGFQAFLDVNGSPAFDSEGNLEGYHIVARDITKRKLMEDELRKSEDRFRTLVESVRDYAIFLLDPEGYIVSWNKGAERIKGYLADEIIGKHFSCFYTKEDIERNVPGENLKRASALGRFEQEGWRLKKDGSTFWAHVIITEIRINDGTLIGFSKVTRDLTERKTAEEAIKTAYSELELRIEERTKELVEANQQLQKEALWRKEAEKILKTNEERYRILYEENPSMYFTVNREGKILSVNRFGIERLGYPAYELIGQSIYNLVQRDDIQKAEEQIAECFENPGTLIYREIRKRRKNGTMFWVQQYARTVKNIEEDVALIVSEDITERKKSEEEVRSQKNMYEAIMKAQSDVGECFLIIENERIIYANEACNLITGYQISELLTLPHFHDLMVPEQQSLLRSRFERITQGQRKGGHYEIEILHKSGERITLEIAVFPLQIDSHFQLILIGRNITERKNIEKALQESESRFRIMSDNAPVMVWTSDSEGLFNYFNKKWLEFTGHTVEEELEKGWHNNIHPDDLQRYLNTYTAAFIARLEFKGEFRMKRFDGEYRWILHHGTPRFHPDHSFAGYIGSCMDITERKGAEDQIKMALEEKETLLQEIHHRVKNNLQVISSLLSLQSRNVKDQYLIEEFKESQNRINTMAFIHENLYQSRDRARVDFAKYTKTLVQYLFNSYGADSRIKLTIDIGDILFNVDKAISCGLIINELVSNSLKHAFPKGKEGEIKVSFHPVGDEDAKDENPDKYELVVSDTGVGFPGNLDFQNTESLGLQLVNALTKQLRADIEFHKKSGTEFRITFTD